MKKLKIGNFEFVTWYNKFLPSFEFHEVCYASSKKYYVVLFKRIFAIEIYINE